MRRALRSARLLASAALCALVAASCSQQQVTVPLRSLERSGKLALLCLDLGSTGDVGYSLEDCQAQRLATKPGGTGGVVRLFAMINQTTRGEVALLDLPSGSVVDTDPSSPGYNFLPVGAQPVDIVATPESTATFVASAEANRNGIYAVPSNRFFRPTILSWPACSLPARPGAMAMMVSPSAGACGGPNHAVDTLNDLGNPAHPGGDLSREQQQPGARKLVVTLPTEGDLLVIDAQKLLDRKPGSFDPCPVERRIKLDATPPAAVDLPGEPPAGDVCPPRPASASSPVCPVRKPQTTTYPADYKAFPSHLAVSERTLYISDEKAPLIHAYDMSDPCEPVELPPLLPSSFDQPWRPVTTSALAVSPLTSKNQRFLYAVDALDGSAMIFDVTEGSGGRTPVVRSRPEYFPFSPRDRLNLGAPIQSLTFVKQDYFPFDLDGTKVQGVRCDPTKSPDSGEVGVAYQTSADFTDGAGPGRLRGVFALAALTSGQVIVVDVDDYDASCRQAKLSSSGSGAAGSATSNAGGTPLPSWVTGCDTSCPSPAPDGSCPACTAELPPYASGESSCRVVVPHEVRTRNYLINKTQVGRNQPGQLTPPQLSLNSVTLRTDASEEARANPKLLGPDSGIDGGRWSFESDGTTIFSGHANPNDPLADKSFVIPDLRDPRTAISQEWSLVYEGVLATTAGKIGRLNLGASNPEERGLFDGNGAYCYNGVYDVDLARLEGLRFFPDRSDEAGLEQFARDHADWLEITSDLLDEEDPYWSTTGTTCNYLRCRATFGTRETPTRNRSFRIRKAYHDRLLIGDDDPDSTADDKPILVPDVTDNGDIPPGCCFPALISYQVRAGAAWVATGSVTGFLHRTTLDATPGREGRCALLGVDTSSGQTCDPTFQTYTGRAYEVPTTSEGYGAARKFDDPYTFHNPNMFFVVYAGAEPSRRGMVFSWQMGSGFSPLGINVGQGSTQVAPQAMLYHPVLGTEVLVTDGAQQGVLTFDLVRLSISRSFL